MNTLAEENYLKAIFSLMDENGEVMVNELSQRLAIKMPTVSSMMKKLANKNLVTYESYKPIRLTDKGRVDAALIIRKHRLTEMYLVEKMGFGWEEVHHIAEQIEHIQSPELFAKMDELLGFPETFCTDHWRCRFKNPNGLFTTQQILDLMGSAEKMGLDVIKTENLYHFDGKPAFSLGQGQ